MRNGFVRAVIPRAVVVAVVSIAPMPVAGQTASVPSPNLPRTAEGRPDLQGYWGGGPANASHSIEDGCCDAVHAKMQSRGPDRLGLPYRLIVDPPDGRIPYQPWAAAQRTTLLYDMETPTKLEHIDTEDRCLLLGRATQQLPGWPADSSDPWIRGDSVRVGARLSRRPHGRASARRHRHQHVQR